eukprot:201827_1
MPEVAKVPEVGTGGYMRRFAPIQPTSVQAIKFHWTHLLGRIFRPGGRLDLKSVAGQRNLAIVVFGLGFYGFSYWQLYLPHTWYPNRRLRLWKEQSLEVQAAAYKERAMAREAAEKEAAALNAFALRQTK